MKNKILLTLSAFALTLVLGLSNDTTQEQAASYQDGPITYMYYDPDIENGIG